MDISATIKALYEERDLLNHAIAALERANASNYRKRGRPPKWLTQVRAASPAPGETPRTKRLGKVAKQ